MPLKLASNSAPFSRPLTTTRDQGWLRVRKQARTWSYVRMAWMFATGVLAGVATRSTGVIASAVGSGFVATAAVTVTVIDGFTVTGCPRRLDGSTGHATGEPRRASPGPA
jgi:hypothetical protein